MKLTKAPQDYFITATMMMMGDDDEYGHKQRATLAAATCIRTRERFVHGGERAGSDGFMNKLLMTRRREDRFRDVRGAMG